ncbi:alpha/beta hydrolase [Actinokineospora sp.]|uniref:alpha/beta hydrolase n=1 Tax=Actinokineospora sp. TaxID=1872133 RepID=UPI004038298D
MLTKPPATTTEPVTTARNLSAGRYREVDVVIIRPAGIPAEPIPVCVALHGGLGGAKSFLDLGLPNMLSALVQEGAAPFAVVAVDGGNWVGHKDDDPQRMLNDELPTWLDYHDLANTPFAMLGIGEGGAGALNLARVPGSAAVAAISPTLFDTWPDAQRSGLFIDQEQWERTEPLRHITEISNMAVGLWCGTGDKTYLGTARTLAERTKAPVASFTPGGHDAAYWREVLPDALKFVGGYL